MDNNKKLSPDEIYSEIEQKLKVFSHLCHEHPAFLLEKTGFRSGNPGGCGLFAKPHFLTPEEAGNLPNQFPHFSSLGEGSLCASVRFRIAGLSLVHFDEGQNFPFDGYDRTLVPCTPDALKTIERILSSTAREITLTIAKRANEELCDVKECMPESDREGLKKSFVSALLTYTK